MGISGDPAAPQHVAGYAYAGLNYQVTLEHPADLRWLDEFLLPHYRRVPPGPGMIEVSLVADQEHFARLAAAFTGERHLSSFVFDSTVKELPACAAGDGGLLLFEESFPVFYQVSPDRRRVNIVGARPSPKLRLAVVRVLREYAMNETQRSGEFFLHASCFLAGERPVIVTGPKMTGKTTLLTFACLRGGGRFLANDRVRVGGSAEGSPIRSIPVIVTVRQGTLGFFPSLKERILAEKMHFSLAAGERLEDLDPRPVIGEGGTYTLSPSQACALFGTGQAAEAHNPIVILPVFTGEAGSFALMRIAPETAETALQESLFGARHWVTATPVFNLAPAAQTGAAARQASFARFCAEVPFLRCTIGRDLYDEPGGAQRWIEALLTAAGMPAPSTLPGDPA